MRVLAVSDIHGRVLNVERLGRHLEREGFRPDVVLVAGDITHFQGAREAIRVLSKVRDVAGCSVLFVPGNCDSPELLELGGIGEGIVNIHSRGVTIGNYTFYGIGGGSISPFHTLIEFSDDAFRDFLLRAEMYSGSGELVIVTHQPIYGFFDDVNGRIGSRAFAEYLERRRPLLWVTGHVHENSGWLRFGRTTIVHPGPLVRGHYAILEISSNAVTHVSTRVI